MAEREPWEDELVEGLVKAGQDNFSAADSEEAMENIAEPIAKAIKQGGSSGQQQSDWNETDPSKVTFIKNKPNLPSDIPSRQEMAAAIGVETTRATAAEGSLQTQINGKASQSSLEAESARAEAAESALDTRLTTAESDIDSLESSVDALYNTEVHGTDGETSVSSSTSGKVKTFVVGLASAIKTKIEAAYSHISDAVKHITATERTNWNTAYSHSQTEGNPHGTEIEEIDGLRTELTTIESDVSAIEGVIPSEATTSNKLADKAFVNSSITTNTATFRGTSAKNLTEAQFLAWANSLTKTKNDYCFWDTTDSDGNVVFKRYKWNDVQWQYEYTLNNSSFTAAQWAAIQSGITAEDVADIGYNTTARHTHANKNLLDTYTQSNASLADAVAKKHEHSNKTILDNTTASYTTEDKAALDGKFDGFYGGSNPFVDGTAILVAESSGTKIQSRNSSLLWNYIKGKADAIYAAISHTHSIANVSGLQSALDKKQDGAKLASEITSNDGIIQILRVPPYTSVSGQNGVEILLYDVTSFFDGTIVTKNNDTVLADGIVHIAKPQGYGTPEIFMFSAKVAYTQNLSYLYSSHPLYGPHIISRDEDGTTKYYLSIFYENTLFSKGAIIEGRFYWYSSNSEYSHSSGLIGTAQPYKQSSDILWNTVKTHSSNIWATKLATPRSIRTNLGSTTAPTFDGSTNITPGVTGTLPIANGGTGATSAPNARTNLDVYSKSETDNKFVSYVTNNGVNVAGNVKNVSKTSPETLFVNNGLIMGGTAAQAGLVTRGICGVTTPAAANGACSKENLYVNYDGNGTYRAARQLIIQAGEAGTHYGNNLYQYAAARGDAVKGFCDATYATKSELTTHTSNTSNPHNVTKSQVGLDKVDNTSDLDKPISTATQTALNGKSATTHTHSVKINGSTKTIPASGGTPVDLGTYLTSHQDISGKADKVSNATKNHFAGLNASGNLIDSGKEASDFATAVQGTKADSAYQKPSSGIPKTDLDTSVQKSLGKADTALQSSDLSGYAKADGSNASGDWAISATKGRIVSRTDFDALVTTGTYEILLEGDELTNSNHPPTEGTTASTCRGFIEVRNVGGTTNAIIQQATYNVGYIATRRRNNNAWTSWGIMTYIPNGSVVGSPTQPVYVDVRGAVQPCSGNDTLFIELAGGNRTLTDNELERYDSVYSSSSDTTTRFINIDATLMVNKKKYFVLLGHNVNLRIKASNLYDAYFHSSKLTLSTSYQEIPSYGFGYRFFTMFRSGYNVYLLGY